MNGFSIMDMLQMWRVMHEYSNLSTEMTEAKAALEKHILASCKSVKLMVPAES